MLSDLVNQTYGLTPSARSGRIGGAMHESEKQFPVKVNP